MGSACCRSESSSLRLAVQPEAARPTLAPKLRSEESTFQDEGFTLTREKDSTVEEEAYRSDCKLLSGSESARSVTSEEAYDIETSVGHSEPASELSTFVLPVRSRELAAGDDSNSKRSLT